MVKKNVIFVRIKGPGLIEEFRCRTHSILGLPAGTYHKFEMENGATVYINDFGLRSVIVADTLEALE